MAEPSVLPDPSAAPPPPALVRVTLARPHTHAGAFFPAGAELEVAADLAEWLVSHGTVARGG